MSTTRLDKWVKRNYSSDKSAMFGPPMNREVLNKQFLKWIGSKQRLAREIISYMPKRYGTYIEPFLGGGAVLGALSPQVGIAGDVLKPLIELWVMLKEKPETLVKYYTVKWREYIKNRLETYLQVRSTYNASPNPLDLLFLSRTCYGGVIRFTKEGQISTPIGPHTPIPPAAFENRVKLWSRAVQGTRFLHADFQETMDLAKEGDVVYCDPPYLYSQSIVYGAQSFSINRLWKSIERCVENGTKVMLSIDGSKKSGHVKLYLDKPADLFKREIRMRVGKSMLRRFQKRGLTMTGEDVEDRLLLTW